MAEETGKLTITGERGGTITEVTQFLSDLENAYLALYAFDQRWPPRPVWRRFPPEVWLELGYPFVPLGQLGYGPLIADAVPPSARLVLERVRIESPGFWEFVASLNPLQQIREYLNDRHRRRQDRGFREASENSDEKIDRLIWSSIGGPLARLGRH